MGRGRMGTQMSSKSPVLLEEVMLTSKDLFQFSRPGTQQYSKEGLCHLICSLRLSLWAAVSAHPCHG